MKFNKLTILIIFSILLFGYLLQNIVFQNLSNSNYDTKGDKEYLEEGLKNRKDILYFGGFEGYPDWKETMRPEIFYLDSNFEIVDTGYEGKALQTFYKKGSYANLDSPVGTSSSIFHINFEKNVEDGIGIGNYDELYLRYLVKFDDNFDFVKSGKLPGLAGGSNNSGGKPPTGYDGWSGRLNWTEKGGIINYMYIPGIEKYGKEFQWNIEERKVFMKPGTWHCLETHYKLNDIGKENGIIQSWFDEKLAVQESNIEFRKSEKIKIDNIMFSTFFRGSTPDFASTKDQYAYFDNFVLSTSRIGCP